LSSSRTGCYFFPSAGKSNQKEPPLKDKKLKTESVRLPDNYRDQTPPSGRQTGKFSNAQSLSFLTLFLLRRFKALRYGGWSCQFEFTLFEAGARAVKTPGRGFVLTRFLLSFHRLEKKEPVRLEDKNLE
jgi:hypothetical protein